MLQYLLLDTMGAALFGNEVLHYERLAYSSRSLTGSDSFVRRPRTELYILYL